jgi:formyltetrahydrofolate-dependent phosphoribosylglycinamide formyltransferase
MSDPMPPASPRPIRLGVLISGGGTTLANFVEQIRAGTLRAELPVVIADRPCGGVERARAAGLRCEVVPRSTLGSGAAFSAAVFNLLRDARVDLVALAGFLARIEIPDDFQVRVMNIHPALIPAFCGKGMYGRHVHEAVLARGCKVSGCTVHFCDNIYDHGPIVLQRCVAVEEGDTPDALAARVFRAESEAYPEAIRLFAAGRLRVEGSRVVISGSGQ